LKNFVMGASASVLIVVSPLIALVSRSAISVAIIGSGDSSVANTVLGELHPQGSLLLVLSRFLPIVLTMATARWAVKRIGPAVLEPVPLIALIATSLSYRLIFEVNLWGYYFMAVAVLLVVIDVIEGRIRPQLVVWLGLVVLAFHQVSHGGDALRTATTFWLPIWFWQLVLVPAAFALASGPLLARARHPQIDRSGSSRLMTPASARAAQIGNPHHEPS
jgi:hypothetical protein